MADLAELGLKVDSAQIETANRSLDTFAASGKNAQLSADALSATATRLGVSVDEVQRRLDAANDNMAANTEQAIKLSDATKMAAASNDNFSDSISSAGQSAVTAGKGFADTVESTLNLANHMKLLALGAYAMFPAFRGLVNSGLKEAFSAIVPAAGLLSSAISSVVSVLSPMLSFFSRISAPIIVVASAVEFLNVVWKTGSDLLEKYGDSLRALYSDDTVQNLDKLTKNQKDIISADQVATATDLGYRLKDAQFEIDRILSTSFDLTDPALRFQAVWVSIKEGVAAALLSIVGMPNAIDNAAKAFGNSSIWDKISGRQQGLQPGFTPASQSVPDSDSSNASSLQAANSKLSAAMGVAALQSENLQKAATGAKTSFADMDKEVDIGSSFIARYSDDIKKLADGVTPLADSWDRVTNSINKSTATLVANSSSVGKSIEFQEQLRVETQLLNGTKGKENEATNDQIDAYTKLRAEGFTPLEAIMTSSIKLDKDRTQSLIDLSETAGAAKLQFAQLTAEIANQKALKADEISTQALTAYSAAQKGVIADLQKRNELAADLKSHALDQEQVDERAASAAKLASDTELHSLSEAQRARALAATQTAATTQASIDAAGLSVGASYKLTAVEQARQQLEQLASTQHKQDAAGNLIIDQAELDRLTLKISKTADLKQTEAEAAAQRTADFNMQTAGLGTVDQQIAAVQKSLHGDGWQAFMNDGLSAMMRTTDAIKSVSSAIETNMVNSLTDIATNAKTVGQGFTEMGAAIVKALESAIIKMLIVEPLMRTLSGILGIGGGPITLGDASGPKAFPSAKGNVFSSGNVIPFANGGVIGQPTMAPMALMGEAGPEAVVPLTRGSDGKLGVASQGGGGGGGVSFGDINITVPDGTKAENAAAVGAAVKSAMIQVVDQRLAYHSRSRGMLNSATG